MGDLEKNYSWRLLMLSWKCTESTTSGTGSSTESTYGRLEAKYSHQLYVSDATQYRAPAKYSPLSYRYSQSFSELQVRCHRGSKTLDKPEHQPFAVSEKIHRV